MRDTSDAERSQISVTDSFKSHRQTAKDSDRSVNYHGRDRCVNMGHVQHWFLVESMKLSAAGSVEMITVPSGEHAKLLMRFLRSGCWTVTQAPTPFQRRICQSCVPASLLLCPILTFTPCVRSNYPVVWRLESKPGLNFSLQLSHFSHCLCCFLCIQQSATPWMPPRADWKCVRPLI